MAADNHCGVGVVGISTRPSGLPTCLLSSHRAMSEFDTSRASFADYSWRVPPTVALSVWCRGLESNQLSVYAQHGGPLTRD